MNPNKSITPSVGELPNDGKPNFEIELAELRGAGGVVSTSVASQRPATKLPPRRLTGGGRAEHAAEL